MKKQTKVFYLCGGMTGLTKEERSKWRQDLVEAFSEWTHVNCFNPENHWDIEDPTVNDKAAMDYDLYRLRNADLMIVNFNNVNSVGSNIELGIAYELRIPILGLDFKHDVFALHPWQFNMCDQVFHDMDSLIDYIRKHYLFDD